MERAKRYLALDGLRGAAAILVVVIHLGAAETSPVPSAYLMVDLFFVLSGFVLAHAYAGPLGRGMRPWRDFMAQRFLRLWPLYMLGTLLGFGVQASAQLGGPGWNPLAAAASLLANTLFLPTPTPMAGLATYAFPFNPPAWTLFCEMAVNLAFAYFAGSRRMWSLSLAACLLAGTALVAVAIGHGGLTGRNPTEAILLGLVRAGYGFFTGVLLYRGRALFERLGWSLPAPAGCLVLLLIGLIPGAGWTRVGIDLALVLAGLPLLVALSSQAAPGQLVGRLCAELGTLSYPLYVVHWPMLKAAEFGFAGLGRGSIHDHPKLMAATVMTILIAALTLGHAELEWRRRFKRNRPRGPIATVNP